MIVEHQDQRPVCNKEAIISIFICVLDGVCCVLRIDTTYNISIVHSYVQCCALKLAFCVLAETPHTSLLCQTIKLVRLKRARDTKPHTKHKHK